MDKLNLHYPNEWDVKTFADLIEKNRSISYGVLKPGDYEVDGVPLVRIVDIKGNRLNCDNLHMISKDLDDEFKRTRLLGNELLVSLVGTIGLFAKADIEHKGFNVHRNIGVIPVNQEKYSKDYLYYASIGEEVQNRIRYKTTGGNQPLYNLKDLNQLEVAIPPLPEQKKIAKILSTVDGHIDEVDGMIEDLKELKKGLMQKLLTEGIGHTEFKDSEVGRIPKEWEVKTLIDISTSKPTYGINAAAKDYIVDGPRYLRISDIDDQGRLLKNDIRSVDAVDYTGYLLTGNDLVFARTGNTTGKSFLYKTEYGELVFAGFLIKFNIDSNLADAEFIAHSCNTKRYWDWVSVMSQRSGQPGINSKEYSSFTLPIPPLEEQKKIALMINGIDKRISLYDDEIDCLSELKKGIMQQLLTGKTRVKIDN